MAGIKYALAVLDGKKLPVSESSGTGSLVIGMKIASVQTLAFETLGFKACFEQLVEMIAFVYKGIANAVQYQCEQHIQNRMLFEKHG